MKAVLLVGGEGTRLRPLTYVLPKAMMPVLGRPFLEYVISHLRAHGIDEIILTLSYKPQALRDYFGDGSQLGVRLEYCLEDPPLGTAGAVRNATSYLSGPFFVLNGDVFTDLSIADMLTFHRRKPNLPPPALSPVKGGKPNIVTFVTILVSSSLRDFKCDCPFSIPRTTDHRVQDQC